MLDIPPACIRLLLVEGKLVRVAQGKKKKRRKHTMIKSVNAVEAVADQIGCDPDDLTLESHTHYGLEVFSNGRKEYAVGTDSTQPIVTTTPKVLGKTRHRRMKTRKPRAESLAKYPTTTPPATPPAAV